jgi:hypothetical protein
MLSSMNTNFKTNAIYRQKTNITYLLNLMFHADGVANAACQVRVCNVKYALDRVIRRDHRISIPAYAEK